MTGSSVRIPLLWLALMAGLAGTASAQLCLAVDEAHDTLAKEERAAALLLLGQQFELAGERVVPQPCPSSVTVSHIRLGSTIVVTMSGPMGSRQATALGLDDLPAVYSQMARSLVTGRPLGSLALVDRTNVSASQELAPRRVHTEGTWYARLGYANLFGPSSRSGGTFGFGYRAEFERLGLDLSFLNFQIDDGDGYYGGDASATTLLKLQGLFFTNPVASRSAYFGGGLSYGRESFSKANDQGFPVYGRGGGLQGNLTAGYEIARITSARVFVQVDATLPFYQVAFETYTPGDPQAAGRYAPPSVTITHEYVPSLAMSIGFGWQRRGR